MSITLIQNNFYSLSEINFNIAELCSYRLNLLNEEIIFKERSHLGMISVGCFLFFLDRLITEKNILRRIVIFIFLFLILVNASTTFYVGFIASLVIILIFNFKYLKRLFPSILFCLLAIAILVNSSSCKKRFTQIPKILNVYNVQEIKPIQNFKLDTKSEDKFDGRVEFDKLYKKRGELINALYSEHKTFYSPEELIIQISKLENDLIALNKDLYIALNNNFTNNLTSQVHIKALNVAKKSIQEKFLGFGYNNYYLANNYYKYDLLSANPFADELNQRDGTNLTVKLIVEYGLISIIFFSICLLFLVSNKIDFELKLFLIPFLITQGLRGAGYWNGGFLMIFMIMLLLLIKSYKLKKDIIKL